MMQSFYRMEDWKLMEKASCCAIRLSELNGELLERMLFFVPLMKAESTVKT